MSPGMELDLARVNTSLADLTANVTTARERVALSLGPASTDHNSPDWQAYYQELAEFQGWDRWRPPPEDRVDTTPDWRLV